MPAERRTTTLSVKVTATIRRQLDDLAEERGQSVGELVRAALASWLKSQRITLSDSDQPPIPPPAAPKASTPAPAAPTKASHRNMAAVAVFVKQRRRNGTPFAKIQDQVMAKFGLALPDDELERLSR